MQSDTTKPLKIALLTAPTLVDRRNSWRIANRYMAQALQRQGNEICHVGPIPLRGTVIVGKIFNKISQILLKRRFTYYQSIYLSKRYARIADQRLAKLDADVIIAPACDAYIGFLKTDIPIILIQGGSVALLHDYYPQFSKILKRSLYEANLLQELALKKASLVLNPSEWGARSLIEDYHTEPQKVHVLPYGANFDPPPSLAVIQQQKKSDRCRLLFVGVGWQRKGGDIAIETLVELEKMGIQAELTVCGSVPPRTVSHERLTVIPYLNKDDEKQYQEMVNLFMTADFFLLPTRLELFGFVFCEASACGLPIITTDTGGVSGAVRNNKNGFVLPFSARGEEYAKIIAKIYQDDQYYAQMVRSSRAAFDERLNWDTWAIAVNKLIDELLASKKAVKADLVV